MYQMPARNLKVFSYNNIGPVPIFIKGIEKLSIDTFLKNKEFFSGACFTCAAVSSKDVHLQRCAGCQLVAYCNKNCQKTDWKKHKDLCKKFPVENGKNVLVRKIESIGKDLPKALDGSPGCVIDVMRELQVQANLAFSIIDDMGCVISGVDKLFTNARVCNMCMEPRPEKLFDCCCTTSYCSTAHKMRDVTHWGLDCKNSNGLAMANWYLRQHHLLRIPDDLLKEANLNNCLKYEKISKLTIYSNEKWLETIVNLVNERLSFPKTIYYALKNLKLGEQKKDLSEIDSLNIHIVHDNPMLDPRMWEFFMHQLPNLKTLNLTFLSALMNLFNKHNTYLPVERCSDCKIKQRMITYNIQPMDYHEYFQSDDYIDPDVVVVFGAGKELSKGIIPLSKTFSNSFKEYPVNKEEEKFRHTDINVEKVHSFTSQRNMTYSKNAIVILTDWSEDQIKTCLKGFHEGRPIKVLLPIQENPVCGFSTLRAPNFLYNNKNNLCCIQGKH